MVTALRSGQGHMGVGDSAEEFISIHALGREGLLVLSCVPSVTSSLEFCFSPVERRKSYCLSFLHTSRQMCFQQKSLIGARHKSPTVE